MKSLIYNSLTKSFVLLLALLATGTVSSQLLEEMEPRYSESIFGDMTAIGNSIMGNPQAIPYHGALDNQNIETVFVDIDSDDTTFNSSSARLSNPEPELSCLSLKKVFLYWAASDMEEENPEDELPWQYDQVKLMLPGETDYQTITADETIYRGRDQHYWNDAYVCVKDISDLVGEISNPFGNYQVANIRAKQKSLEGHDGVNIGTSGGWTMIFVYNNPLLPRHKVTIFDGFAVMSYLEEGDQNYDIPITNFQTIPEGPVRAKLTFGMLEGDRSLEGDELLMKNTSGDYVKLSTDTRPEDNFFNSRITMNGEDFLDRNPASSNTLGYDLGLFELDNTGNQFLDNNQTSTSIRIASTRELFNFYMIGFSVHVWEPTLQDFMLTSESYDIAPGETTVLSLNIDNGWNDDIQDLNISTIIPEGFDFVGVIGLPDGVSYSYDEDTRVLTFTKDSITLDDTAFSLNFEVRAKSRCFFVENDCQDSISIQSNATYNGTINPSGFTSLSSHTKDACEIPNDDATTFNVDMGDQGCDPNFVEQTFELSACVFDGMMDLTTYIPDGMPDNGTYTYTSGNGGELNNGIFNPRNADAGQHLVTYSVPDETCTRSLEFQIDLNRDCPNPNCELEDIIISKALTLNGDNINDVFLVSTEEDCNYTYNITIFNRWGNIVYENPDYQNDWEGTAPENAMGEAYTLPTGTYYYILKVVELDNQAKSGYFYLGTD